MSDKSAGRTSADDIYGDGELPGDADLVASASGDEAASIHPEAPETLHSESNTTEEK